MPLSDIHHAISITNLNLPYVTINSKEKNLSPYNEISKRRNKKLYHDDSIKPSNNIFHISNNFLRLPLQQVHYSAEKKEKILSKKKCRNWIV